MIKNYEQLYELIKSLIFKISLDFKKMPKEIFFVVNAIIYSAVFILSAFSVMPLNIVGSIYHSYRYLVPLYPLFFIIVAVSLSDLTKSRNNIFSFSGYIVFIILIGLGVLNNFSIAKYDGVKSWDINGFSYSRQGWFAGRRFGKEFNYYLESANKIDDTYRNQYYYGLGRHINARGLIWKKDFEEYCKIQKQIDNIDERYKVFYYEGIGYSLGANIVKDESYMEKLSFSIEKNIPENIRYYVYLGVAKLLDERVSRQIKLTDILKSVDKKYWKIFYPLEARNLFLKDNFYKSKNIEQIISDINKMTEEEKQSVYQGIGKILIQYSKYDLKTFNELIKTFPEDAKPLLFESAGQSMFQFEKRGVFVSMTDDCIAKRLSDMPDYFQSTFLKSIYRGIGRYIADKYGFNIDNTLIFLNTINPQYRKELLEGIGTEIAFKFAQSPQIADMIINEFSLPLRDIVRIGYKNEVRHYRL